MISRWSAGGLAAAAAAARRGDLWPAGALAELPSLGWLPLVLAVVPAPSISELTFRGVEFAGAPGLPLRLVALASVALGTLLLVRLASAFGQAAVLRGRRDDGRAYAPGPVTADAGSFVVAEVVAFLPALLATGLLLAAAAEVAPRVWQRPDIGGIGALGRLAGAVAPHLAVLLATILVGQMVAAAARRRVIGPGAGIGETARGTIHDLRSQPLALAALAAAAFALRLAFVVGSVLLLRMLWAPVASRISASDPFAPAVLPLLIGFVFAWLCLVAAAGALHVWISGWWMALLADDIGEAIRTDERGARWMRRPSSS